jgi:hypothetical protein
MPDLVDSRVSGLRAVLRQKGDQLVPPLGSLLCLYYYASRLPLQKPVAMLPSDREGFSMAYSVCLNVLFYNDIMIPSPMYLSMKPQLRRITGEMRLR